MFVCDTNVIRGTTANASAPIFWSVVVAYVILLLLLQGHFPLLHTNLHAWWVYEAQ